jgi:hypothetical protein
MEKPGVDPNDAFTSQQHDFDERPFRVNPGLQFVPIVGLIAFSYGVSRWRPLNPVPLYWLGFGLFFLSVFLLSHIRKKAKSGDDVRSYFPAATWLAFGPAFMAMIVLVNGPLDSSPVEQHQQAVTRKYITRGRSTSYYVEFSSWRPDHATERASVSPKRYAEFQVNDPVIIDVHKGALGIPWMGTIRKTRIDSLR